MSSYETLSEVDGLGRVVLCRNCEEVYVCIGHASYRLPLAAFRELGQMVRTSRFAPGSPFSMVACASARTWEIEYGN